MAHKKKVTTQYLIKLGRAALLDKNRFARRILDKTISESTVLCQNSLLPSLSVRQKEAFTIHRENQQPLLEMAEPKQRWWIPHRWR